MSKIKLTSGRNNREALSRKIEHEIKREIAPDLMKKVASETRQEFMDVTRAHFLAMLTGVESLVNDSGVPAAYDEDEQFVGHRKIAGKVYKSRQYERKSIAGEVKHTEALKYGKNRPYGMPDAVSTSFKIRWKKLSAQYAKRHPKSKQFYRKRQDRDPKSARVAFNNAAQGWKARAKPLSVYQKSTLSFPYDPVKGVMKVQFRINFPNLDAQFDFLRRAFLTGRKDVLVPDLGGNGASGIAQAEMRRPLLRPYAAAVGTSWRKSLNEIGKRK